MSHYQRILVAIDPLGDYQPVVDRAKAMANPDSEMLLIYVHEPFVYIDMRYADAGAEKNQIAEAQRVLATIGDALGVPADKRLIEKGKPAKRIHKQVEALGVDLVIMGTHGRNGVQLLLGSTANAVLHGTRCDVLAVRV